LFTSLYHALALVVSYSLEFSILKIGIASFDCNNYL
jgi:hypothetical protein